MNAAMNWPSPPASVFGAENRCLCGGLVFERFRTGTERHASHARHRVEEADSFDNVIVDVDGYLCGLKDAQIRGGLHILGDVPEGESLVDLVLAITRLGHGTIPSLRLRLASAVLFGPRSPPHHAQSAWWGPRSAWARRLERPIEERDSFARLLGFQDV